MKIFLISILFLLFAPFPKKGNTISNTTHKCRKSILIGDSNVGVIKSTPGFYKTNTKVGTYKGGINTNQLIQRLKSVKVDTTINCIFVAIGTNDGYIGSPSSKLRLELNRVYPNAKELYVIYGSRGWGGVKYCTLKQQDDFYHKFELNGFKLIRITTGYFPNDKFAHSFNQSFFKDIIKRIGEINFL